MFTDLFKPLETLGLDPVIAVYILIAATTLGPFVTAALKRLSFIDSNLGNAINMTVNLAAFVVLWVFVEKSAPDKFLVYMIGGLAAGGGGSAINNWWRKRVRRFTPEPDPLATGEIRQITGKTPAPKS